MKKKDMWVAEVWLGLVAFWVIGAAGDLWAGTVLVRDGTSYTGKVEFKAGNQLLVTTATNEAVTIRVEDLVRLSMLEAGPGPSQSIERDRGLPVPWRQADIGRVKEPGSGSEDKGIFRVRGAGWGIWGAADSFHLVYQPFAGDVDLLARVGEPPTEKNPLVAGLTIRESLEPTSFQASVMLFPKGEARMSCRPIDGPGQFAPAAEDKPYQWVRLVRAGNLFSGYCSPDGESWLPVGAVKIKMAAKGYVGLACAATLNQGAVGTTFDHVAVWTQPLGPVEGFGLIDGSVIVGKAKQLDEQVFQFTDEGGKERSVPARTVAYVFTRPLPSDMRKALAKGKEGISLLNGDQVEGSVQGLSAGKVTIDSVLFGRKAEQLSKILAVVLHSPETSGGFFVSTRDGSVYRCTGISVGDGVVVGLGGLTGTVSVKATDLAEVCRSER